MQFPVHSLGRVYGATQVVYMIMYTIFIVSSNVVFNQILNDGPSVRPNYVIKRISKKTFKGMRKLFASSKPSRLQTAPLRTQIRYSTRCAPYFVTILLHGEFVFGIFVGDHKFLRWRGSFALTQKHGGHYAFSYIYIFYMAWVALTNKMADTRVSSRKTSSIVTGRITSFIACNEKYQSANFRHEE